MDDRPEKLLTDQGREVRYDSTDSIILSYFPEARITQRVSPHLRRGDRETGDRLSQATRAQNAQVRLFLPLRRAPSLARQSCHH
jgi:hypothetical protein